MRGGDALSWVVWRPAVTKPGRGVTGGEEVLERVSSEALQVSVYSGIGKVKDWWVEFNMRTLT